MVEYGRIRLDTILIIELCLLIFLPCYTYYIAVYKYGIAPFPHTTVTNTACPYPQNIAFRFGMMTASSFLALVFFCISKWIKYQKQRTNYPGNIPSLLYTIS